MPLDQTFKEVRFRPMLHDFVGFTDRHDSPDFARHRKIGMDESAFRVSKTPQPFQED
jgi:hypothetical protein